MSETPDLIDQWCSGCGEQMHEGEPLHKVTDPGHSQYVPPLAAARPSPAEHPAGDLRARRRAAADLCAATAARLTELGFGCEIIATWEARSGERTAAHVITPNPAAPR